MLLPLILIAVWAGVMLLALALAAVAKRADAAEAAELALVAIGVPSSPLVLCPSCMRVVPAPRPSARCSACGAGPAESAAPGRYATSPS